MWRILAAVSVTLSLSAPVQAQPLGCGDLKTVRLVVEEQFRPKLTLEPSLLGVHATLATIGIREVQTAADFTLRLSFVGRADAVPYSPDGRPSLLVENRFAAAQVVANLVAETPRGPIRRRSEGRRLPQDFSIASPRDPRPVVEDTLEKEARFHQALLEVLHEACGAQAMINVLQTPASGLNQRKAAARLLSKGDINAFRTLLDIVGSERFEPTRAELINEIVAVRGESSSIVPALIAALTERSRLATALAEPLAATKDPRVRDALASFVSSDDRELAFRAAVALAKSFRDPRAIPLLIAMAENKDLRTVTNREVAVRALGNFESPETAALLERLVDDNTPTRVGVAAIEGIRNVAFLIDKLRPDDASIAGAAARRLGELKADAAIGPLIDTMEAAPIFARENIRASLKAITGRDYGVDVAKWRRWHATRRR